MNSQNNTQLKVDSILIEHHERVKELGGFFNSEMISRHQKNFQLALEIALYFLFASFIFVMILLPNTESAIRLLFNSSQLTDPVGTMIWIKMSFFMLSLIPLFSALHLSSKRLKGRLFLRRQLAGGLS